MVTNVVTKEEIQTTESLEDAVKLIFGVDIIGRNCILNQEAMTGDVAKEYDELGKNHRAETYRKIASEIALQVKSSSTILDVGCGSGLLSFELARRGYGVVGVDLSEDMIALAERNLRLKLQDAVEEYDLNFRLGSVYNLDDITSDIDEVNAIVCRNSLHRFNDPKKALEKMYSRLTEGGLLYIRDLKRDAAWREVVSRIGEERWKTKTLVKDYIGAMASMLTTKKLKEYLDDLGIIEYNLRNGDYETDAESELVSIDEHAQNVEYVCVINKG